MPTHSYDAGEHLRVIRDDKNVLRIHHGGSEIATLKSVIGGGVRLDAHGRTWRLTTDEAGWRATGDPPATLRHRALRGDRLTIGGHEYTVSSTSVKGPDGLLLRAAKTKDARRPALTIEIVTPPPQSQDPHASVALATAALVMSVDLNPTRATPNFNGDNVSAALRYAPGL
ncbi:MAG TPA: hypothetical protein VF549_06580 [Solirubrobacteraceae bacterium]